MTSQPAQIDEWLNRAFQLAFFLHGDRETAKKIALSAMNKLEVASNAQFKRYYYQPVGRAETSRATRSRVSLNDLQLLQRLVFVESENFEREKEKAGRAGERSLLVYFIKHLVRISLKRNSFYVTLGVSRILHNYATNDAMELYNLIVQDPERVHDDYYYRSRKGVLMKELKMRFGRLLETVKVNRGEERFDHKNDAEELNKIAKDCLQFFTPWNSRCAMPEKFDPFDDIIKPFHFDKDDPDAEHRIEINRIHAALHPDCFNRLTDALTLPPSEKKLEIPKFMISEDRQNNDENNDDFGDPPHLETDELQTIKDILAAQAASRRAVSANLLRVVVDGDEHARINLEETDKVNFELGDNAELIEVRVVEKDGDMVLATHLLSFEDLEKGIQMQSVMLEGGQKVSFNLAPTVDEYGEVVGINCGVEYAETAKQEKPFVMPAESVAGFSISNWFQNLNWLFKPVLALGLIVLVAAAGWFVYRQRGENDLANKDDLPPANNKIVVPGPREEKPETPEKEVPPPSDLREQDDPVNPENNKLDTSGDRNAVKPKLKKERRVSPPMESVPPKILQAQNEKPKADEDGIWRLPMRDTGNNFDETQSTRSPKLRGKSLKEIKRIYLDISGDEDFGRQISEQISDELLKNDSLTVAPRDTAEARLIIYVRRESDEKQPESGTVTAIVRLVNAEGYVIYPNRKNITGWKYVGKAVNLPKRIIKDLAAARSVNKTPIKR